MNLLNQTPFRKTSKTRKITAATVAALLTVCATAAPAQVPAPTVPAGMLDWGAPPLDPTEMNAVMTWIAAQTAAINLPFCWRQSYGNGAGEPYACAPGLERNGLLCYPTCKPGFAGNGPVCWQSCPAGFKDTGADCLKPSSYARGAGYVIWQKGNCEHDNPQGCEQSGALWYPKCKAGFHAVGCCVCSPDCPADMTDIGVSCAKQNYTRGAGQTLAMGTCAPGLQKDPSGALCYPVCKAGFHMVGPVCWQNCPAQQPADCAAGCASDSKACASAVVNQVLSPIMMVASLIPIGGEISDAAKAAKGASTAAEEAAEVSKLAQIGAKLKELYAPVKDALTAAQGKLEDLVGGPENLQIIFAVGKAGSSTYTLASAVNKQIDLYSREVADNFTDMTSVAINAQIDSSFGPPAAYQIKRQWGIRSMLMNMDSDGFATAKHAISAASAVDPTGILNCVSAYMQPICENSVPFPVVHPFYGGQGTVQKVPSGATPSASLHAFTILSHDPASSPVYYYSTSPQIPANFSPAAAPSFRVSAFAAPGTVPVYLYTIAMADQTHTLVYYYSPNKTPPPSFNGPQLAFYAYAQSQPGTVPVYAFFARAHDSASTQLYYYSSKDDAPPGYTKAAEASFWAWPAQ